MTGLSVKRASGQGTRVVSSTVLWAAWGAIAIGLLVSGCGEAQRDAGEVKANYKVEVTRARFPAKQAVARDTALTLVVRNAGLRTIPNVAVTIDSFYYTSDYPNLASNKRPVWIVNTGPGVVPKRPVNTEEVTPPGGGETVFVNTWALGTLAPGASRRFVWRVTPVKAGVHTVNYAVSAGLDGKAHTTLAGGGLPVGRFVASIAPKPPPTHVNPQTGKVVPGPYPVPSTPQPAAQ